MKCKVCGKQPHEIEEYVYYAKENEMTPEEFVWQQEGTYNPETQLFYCTECYFRVGMPLGTA